MLVHSLLIFVPLYLIKIKEFKVELKNIWNVLAGYNFIGSVAMSASIISGNNFAFSLKLSLFDLPVAFPWHLPLLLCMLFAIALALYGGFELARYIKRKHKHEDMPPKQQSNKNNWGATAYLVGNISAILFGTIIMLVTAQLIGSPTVTGNTTWLGLLCLLGLAYMICVLIVSEKNKIYLGTNVAEKKEKSILIIVLTILFVLPLGIINLVAYLKSIKTEKTKEV